MFAFPKFMPWCTITKTKINFKSVLKLKHKTKINCKSVLKLKLKLNVSQY